MTLAESSLPPPSKAKAKQYTDSDYDEFSRTIDEFIAQHWDEIDAGVEKDRRTPPTIRSPSPPPLHDNPVPSKADTLPLHDTPVPSKADTPPLHDTPVPSKADTFPLHDTTVPSKPETPPFHDVPLLTDSQATLRGDDASPRTSKFLLSPESPSERLGKRKGLGKRKATDLGDDGMMGAGGARKIRKVETTAKDDAPIVPVRAASI